MPDQPSSDVQQAAQAALSERYPSRVLSGDLQLGDPYFNEDGDYVYPYGNHAALYENDWTQMETGVPALVIVTDPDGPPKAEWVTRSLDKREFHRRTTPA